jgi:hypothetical protein
MQYIQPLGLFVDVVLVSPMGIALVAIVTIVGRSSIISLCNRKRQSINQSINQSIRVCHNAFPDYFLAIGDVCMDESEAANLSHFIR